MTIRKNTDPEWRRHLFKAFRKRKAADKRARHARREQRRRMG